MYYLIVNEIYTVEVDWMMRLMFEMDARMCGMCFSQSCGVDVVLIVVSDVVSIVVLNVVLNVLLV